MPKFKVKGDQLKRGRKVIGPASALYYDSRETIAHKAAIQLHMEPRIDYIFTAGNKVVGVESKKTADLISSWRARRLQRQLREMADVVDVPCLLIRADNSFFRDIKHFPELRNDLLKFQLLGGYILFGPTDDERIPDHLQIVRGCLTGKRNLRTIVSGTDLRKVRGTKQEIALQKLFRGCGPVMARKLLDEFGTVGAILCPVENRVSSTTTRAGSSTSIQTAHLKRLRQSGASKSVVQQVKELL